MRLRLLAATVFPCGILVAVSASAQSPPPEPYLVLKAQSLAELLARLRPQGREDLVGKSSGTETLMYVQRERDKLNEAETHAATDDYHFVLDGSASYTLGGRLEDPREVRPGESRAPSIAGGIAVDVEKGDLVFVPRGIPHQRSTAGRAVAVMLIKVCATHPKTPPGGGAAAAPLVGLWRLADSYDLRVPSGEIVRSRGARPTGTLAYHADGRMSVQVMSDGRPRFTGAPGTAAEIASALEGYTAYFGRFEVRAAESVVVHHMEGSLFPNEVGGSRTRFFSVDGDRLTLTTPPFESGGEKRARVILWERAD